MPKSWPYCEGHPDCHDPHTKQYSYGGSTSTVGYIFGDSWRTYRVTVASGTRSPIYGERLCRAHALIKYRVA